MRKTPKFMLYNPYNILTQLAALFRHTAEDYYFDAAKRAAWMGAHQSESEKAVFAFLQGFPQLNDCFHCLSYGIPEETADALLAWAEQRGPGCTLALIQELDSLFSWREIISSVPLAETGSFSSLNDNVEETGFILLPRVSAVSDDLTPAAEREESSAEGGEATESEPFDLQKKEGEQQPGRKRWIDRLDEGINREIQNTYYVAVQDLKNPQKIYSLENVIVSKTDFDIKDSFRIAFAPIAKDVEPVTRELESEDEDAIPLFHFDGITNPKRAYKRIEAAHLEACRQQADILIFPELLGTQEMLGLQNGWSKTFSDFSRRAEKEGIPAPFLTLAPSCWHDCCNRVYVLDETGILLCAQQKQYAFDGFDKNGIRRLEDLSKSEPEIVILHVPGLGRLTIPICRDLLFTDYHDLLVRTLHSTLMLCPSFSPGKSLFKLDALRDRAYGCYLFWGNACSACDRKPAEYVGLFSAPQTREPEVTLIPKCGGDCGSDTTACLFVMDIQIGSMESGSAPHIWKEMTPDHAEEC